MNYFLKTYISRNQKNWVARIKNSDMEFAFLDGEWTNIKGVLGWRDTDFIPGEFYVSQFHRDRTYYEIIEENDQFMAKEIEFDQVVLALAERESPFIEKKVVDVAFSLQTQGPKGVVWISDYHSVSCIVSENQDFFHIVGEFSVCRTKAMRNFMHFESFKEKTENIDKMLKRDKSEFYIKYTDGTVFNTVDEHVEDGSLRVSVPLGKIRTI